MREGKKERERDRKNGEIILNRKMEKGQKSHCNVKDYKKTKRQTHIIQ